MHITGSLKVNFLFPYKRCKHYGLDLLTPYSTVARASVKAWALQGMRFSRQNGNCKHLMKTNHQHVCISGKC